MARKTMDDLIEDLYNDIAKQLGPEWQHVGNGTLKTWRPTAGSTKCDQITAKWDVQRGTTILTYQSSSSESGNPTVECRPQECTSDTVAHIKRLALEGKLQ